MKKLKDFPNEFIQIKTNINLLKTQVERAENYSNPSSMDDKWYITCEDYFINFYRTWTGRCIYKAKMDPYKKSIVEVYINNNIEEYKFSDINEEIILFNRVLDLLLPR